jgi:hypothetical protein
MAKALTHLTEVVALGHFVEVDRFADLQGGEPSLSRGPGLKSLGASSYRIGRYQSVKAPLIQLRRDRGKGGVELRTDALHYRNDGESYPSGNEAIFNGGRPRLVLQKGS